MFPVTGGVTAIEKHLCSQIKPSWFENHYILETTDESRFIRTRLVGNWVRSIQSAFKTESKSLLCHSAHLIRNLVCSNLFHSGCLFGLRTNPHRTRDAMGVQIQMFFLWCCLRAVWTPPFTSTGPICSRRLARPVWIGPKREELSVSCLLFQYHFCDGCFLWQEGWQSQKSSSAPELNLPSSLIPDSRLGAPILSQKEDLHS